MRRAALRPRPARAVWRPRAASASSWAPSRSSVPSSAGRPASWTAIGRPVLALGQRQRDRRLAGDVEDGRVGRELPGAAEVLPGLVAAGVDLADAHGPLGERRGEDRVVVVPQRDDLARDRRSAGCGPGGSPPGCGPAGPSTSSTRAAPPAPRWARARSPCRRRPWPVPTGVPNTRVNTCSRSSPAQGASTSSTSWPSEDSRSAASRDRPLARRVERGLDRGLERHADPQPAGIARSRARRRARPAAAPRWRPRARTRRARPAARRSRPPCG